MKKIFILLIVFVCLSIAGYAQESEKLFNGSDLSGWNFVINNNEMPAEEVFYVRDGILTITGNPFGYMYTQKKYSNYHLQAEWRWPQGVESNSGIFLLIEETFNPFPKCVECQLCAGKAGDFVLLSGADLGEYKSEPNTPRPKFPVVQRTNESSEKTAGEWNKADIYCYNGVILVYINGVFQNKGTSKVKEGNIALQSEGNFVQFRNVVLTPLF